jgi:hypothetical protein
MEDHVAFLPHLQESIMDELRTTEGMIFRDEGAKKLFLDTKSFLLETFITKWKNFDTESFHAALDEYIGWNEGIEQEELQRMKTSYRDIASRLTSVTVLYAKYLYARSNPDSNILIRRPKVNMLLKGMFTRLARMHHVRNGSFFDLDPLRQDFVLRDIFRQTLGSDCIQLMDEAPAVSILEEEESSVQQDALKLESIKESETGDAEAAAGPTSDAVATESNEMNEKAKDDDEVYPDDSISRVMERAPLFQQPQVAKENASAAESTASKAQSRVSEFRRPTAVRRVHITDIDDEKV